MIVTSDGKPAVILTVEKSEHLRKLDRRALRLDQLADAALDEMIAAEIPPELRYRIDDIPETP